MTHPDQNEVTTGASSSTELDMLKEEATQAGLTFSPNIGIGTLRDKLRAHLEEQEKPIQENFDHIVKRIPPQKTALSKGQEKALLVKAATKLIRVRVVCMNPNKKDWEGEIFTASNSIVPTQKKYVPFNSDDPWFVPQIILNVIKERKCQVFKPAKGPKGEKIRKGTLVPEFSIEIFDSITEDELHELANTQGVANNLQ